MTYVHMHQWDWKASNVQLPKWNNWWWLSLFILILYLKKKLLYKIKVIARVLREMERWKFSDLKLGLDVSAILQSSAQITESHRGLCKPAKAFSDVMFLSLLFQTVFCQWSTDMNLCPLWQRNNRRTAQSSSTAIFSPKSRSFPVLSVRVSSVARIIFIIMRNSNVANRRGLIVLTALIARNTYRTFVHMCAENTLAIKYTPSMCAK